MPESSIASGTVCAVTISGAVLGPTDLLDAVSRPRMVLFAAIVVLSTLGVVLAIRAVRTDTATAGDEMVQIAPGGQVALSALPTTLQTLYLAAADDPEAFERVACYCGCEAFLDHRHLLDCFVRPDGGWERHATGCAVCLAEARDVIDLRAADTPIDQITRRIDDQYGAITEPSA